MIFIDFETRSPSDLIRGGGRRYARHPRTEIVCGAALDLPSSTIYTWTPWDVEVGDWQPERTALDRLHLEAHRLKWAPLHRSDSPPPALLAKVEKGVPLVAHNANGFDRFLWEGLGLPPALWVDSLPRARRVGLPGGLEKIGQALFGLGKDAGGATMRVTMSPADGPECPVCGAKKRKHCRQPCADCDPDECPHACPPLYLDPDGPRLTHILRYCVQDVLLLACAWLDAKLGEPHPDDPVLKAHDAIDERGFLVDVDAAVAIARLEHEREQRIGAEVYLATEEVIRDCVPYIQAVSLTTLRSPSALQQWLAGKGVVVTNAQAATIEAALERPDLTPETRLVLEARLQLAHVTAGKVAALLEQVCPDGRMRGALTYWGAHTGRWAGRGFQPQNLPRPDEKVLAALPADIWDRPEDVPAVTEEREIDTGEALAQMLRGLIRAPDGMVLGIADYSQIEARTVLWLAGDPGLEVFRHSDAHPDEPDPYKVFIAPALGIQPSAVKGPQRQAGKVTVLGCGYQMGARRLAEQAVGMGLDLAAVGVTAAELVERWRDAHPGVAGTRTGAVFRSGDGDGVVHGRTGGLWKDLTHAAKRALEGEPSVAGRCEFQLDGRHLVVILPSDRYLVYRHARIELVPARWGGQTECVTYQSGHMRKPLYGGKWAENLTQAVARDLLADALVQLETAGVRVVLHVHDEIVAELRDPRDVALLEAAMKNTPPWADGLPVAVEAHTAKRFGKK